VTHPLPPRRLVVDANVVVKWFLADEEFVREARALRDDCLSGVVEVVSPSLLPYEIANTLHTAARRGRLAADDADAAMAIFLEAEIPLHLPPGGRVLQLARQLQISTYDASYLVTAEETGADLWTADGPLFRSVSPQVNFVRWLAEYQPAGESPAPGGAPPELSVSRRPRQARKGAR
jgi:predicted nucleic acid-binding protein